MNVKSEFKILVFKKVFLVQRFMKYNIYILYIVKIFYILKRLYYNIIIYM